MSDRSNLGVVCGNCEAAFSNRYWFFRWFFADFTLWFCFIIGLISRVQNIIKNSYWFFGILYLFLLIATILAFHFFIPCLFWLSLQHFLLLFSNPFNFLNFPINFSCKNTKCTDNNIDQIMEITLYFIVDTPKKIHNLDLFQYLRQISCVTYHWLIKLVEFIKIMLIFHYFSAFNYINYVLF